MGAEGGFGGTAEFELRLHIHVRWWIDHFRGNVIVSSMFGLVVLVCEGYSRLFREWPSWSWLFASQVVVARSGSESMFLEAKPAFPPHMEMSRSWFDQWNIGIICARSRTLRVDVANSFIFVRSFAHREFGTTVQSTHFAVIVVHCWPWCSLILIQWLPHRFPEIAGRSWSINRNSGEIGIMIAWTWLLNTAAPHIINERFTRTPHFWASRSHHFVGQIGLILARTGILRQLQGYSIWCFDSARVSFVGLSVGFEQTLLIVLWWTRTVNVQFHIDRLP